MASAIANKRQPRYRRSRAHRRRVQLSDRDLRIFEYLNRYRYLRSTYTYALVRRHYRTCDYFYFIKRLGHLFQEGYLDVPKQQLQYANARYMPNIHALSEKGVAALTDHGRLKAEVVGLDAGKHRGSEKQFAHRVMISDVLASIELAIGNHDGLRFVDFAEIVTQMPDRSSLRPKPMAMRASATIDGRTREFDKEPDALFGIEYDHRGKKLYRFFALEADRRTEAVKTSTIGRSSFLLHYLAYADIGARKEYKSQFGLPNLMVLFVTTRSARMNTMLKAVDEQTKGHGSAMLCFKVQSSLGDFERAPKPDAGILREPWFRSGRDAIRLDVV